MSGDEAGPGHLLCLGLGYTAERLARRLAGEGFSITGTSRAPEGCIAIADAGWHAVAFDCTALTPEVAAAIADATHILVSIAPPDASGDPVLPCLADALAAAPRLRWIGYLSTIGVYGDHGGVWIDETTPVNPTNARSQWRVDAERQWLAFAEARAKRVEIFRLPGIYGPGRSFVEQLLAGTARRIVKPGQVFNRIHVDDIANALATAIAGAPAEQIYNLADDEPAPAEEAVAYAARLLGMEPPPSIPFESANLSPMAASFYSESKRVSNARMKEKLGVTLLYPTYREGLAAIARELGHLRPE